jgi:regulator of protease activity HflC (stomatin/prohibitin superfamily)
MDNTGILEHLLKIEAEAAALVKDAQAEADKRIAEAEKQNRALFETRYQDGAAALEAEFQRETSGVREQYRNELAAYRGKMETIKTDAGRFSAELESLVAGES